MTAKQKACDKKGHYFIFPKKSDNPENVKCRKCGYSLMSFEKAEHMRTYRKRYHIIKEFEHEFIY